MSEDFLCEWLFEPASLAHVIKQVTSRTQLHHNYDVLLRLDRLINLDDVVVSQLQLQWAGLIQL